MHPWATGLGYKGHLDLNIGEELDLGIRGHLDLVVGAPGPWSRGHKGHLDLDISLMSTDYLHGSECVPCIPIVKYSVKYICKFQTENAPRPTDNAPPRRIMHHPDGLCTTPTDYAPPRRILHLPDGFCTFPTDYAPVF